jgi:hypothetical protein
MNVRYVFAILLLLAAPDTRLGQTQTRLGPGRKYTSVERMNLSRLRAVHEDRIRHSLSRRPVQLKTGLKDFRAILHAHAEDAPHTGGTRPEMLKAAREAGVDLIMLTDHNRPERDFINDSWRGMHDKVLFVPGSESDGFLIYPVASIRGKESGSREEFIKLVKRDGGNIFLSHVEERPDWETGNIDGLEIYNHHTDVKDETEFNRWLQGALSDLPRLRQIEQALELYPQEVFAAQQDYLASIIQKWDKDASHHRLTGVAANDCHHNQVFTITAIDDKTIEVGFITSRPVRMRVTSDKTPGVAALVKGRRPGDLIGKLDFDPYERSFRYVTTHILADKLTEQHARDALRDGHAYVAHDWLCDPTGFAFIAQASDKKTRAIMGDRVERRAGLKIKAETPAGCTLRLFRNGVVIKTVEGRRLEFEPDGPGVYRLEAWLTADGELRPWIYSNPIYVD